jgi:hypothetical protein
MYVCLSICNIFRKLSNDMSYPMSISFNMLKIKFVLNCIFLLDLIIELIFVHYQMVVMENGTYKKKNL